MHEIWVTDEQCMQFSTSRQYTTGAYQFKETDSLDQGKLSHGQVDIIVNITQINSL